MSDANHPHPHRRRRLLKLGLTSPLLLPLHAAHGSAPILTGRAASSVRNHDMAALSSAPPSGGSPSSIGSNQAIAAIRMWPSREYTRVTFELTRSIPFHSHLIDNPNRVILDLQGLQLESKVHDLISRISTQDPFVRQVRVGQFKPGTLRIVFDLKQPVAPQIFTLKPAAGYQYRLVLDLYPKQAIDPLDQLIADSNDRPAATSPRSRTHRAQAQADSRAPNRARGRSQTKGTPEMTRIFTVAIDPGHGGEDPGATGPMGTHEKDVVLSVAHKVRKLLAREENLRVFLTRDDDYYVPLAKRVSKARGIRADLFVSIHADAFVRPDARGSSVFVLSNHGASSLGAQWLAHSENQADLIGGINIKTASAAPEAASLLMDLYTTSQIRDSKALAKRVLNELGQIGRLHNASVEQANFAVLRSPDVPSVLVETAFISNPDEEQRLRHAGYQDELARAIARGILDYRKANPPGPRGKIS